MADVPTPLDLPTPLDSPIRSPSPFAQRVREQRQGKKDRTPIAERLCVGLIGKGVKFTDHMQSSDAAISINEPTKLTPSGSDAHNPSYGDSSTDDLLNLSADQLRALSREQGLTISMHHRRYNKGELIERLRGKYSEKS